jgi:hypothetical protein
VGELRVSAVQRRRLGDGGAGSPDDGFDGLDGIGGRPAGRFVEGGSLAPDDPE